MKKVFDLMQIFIKKEDPGNAWISTATITLKDEKTHNLRSDSQHLSLVLVALNLVALDC